MITGMAGSGAKRAIANFGAAVFPLVGDVPRPYARERHAAWDKWRALER
jgi:hypothetical protein